MKNWIAVWKLFKLQLIIKGRTHSIVSKNFDLSENIQISSGYVDLGSVWDPCESCVISIGMCVSGFLYVHYHQLH